MKAEAEANAEADKKERERIDKINQADSVIFQTEKQLKDLGDKIPADKKSELEAALAKLKEAHKAQDIPAIDTAMENLNKIAQAMSEAMYSQAGAQGAGNPGSEAGFGGNAGSTNTGSQDSGDGVTDADFEEVK